MKFTTIALLLASSTAALAGNVAVIVLDSEGKPAPNVVLTVIPTNKGPASAAKEPSAVMISQERLQFQPYVTAIAVGTKVKFSNKDSFQHHTKSFSPAKTFELRMDGAKDGKPFVAAEEVLFDRAGHVFMQCHFHGSMRGHIMVTDTPYFGVTNANGAVVIANVPNGDVELRAWHPEQFLEQKSIRVNSTADTASASMTLNMAPRPRRP